MNLISANLASTSFSCRPPVDCGNPTNASTRMSGGQAVFENDNYRITAGDDNTVTINNKNTGETRNAGPLFDANSSFSYATAEQWYFSRSRPSAMYLGENGPRMLRYDVLSKTVETVFDVTSLLGSGKYLFSHLTHRVHLDLVDTKTYSTGLVSLTYAVVNKK